MERWKSYLPVAAPGFTKPDSQRREDSGAEGAEDRNAEGVEEQRGMEREFPLPSRLDVLSADV